MSHVAKTLLAVALACLAAGLIGRNFEILDGLGKALFGVFMTLFFIVRFFGEERA